MYANSRRWAAGDKKCGISGERGAGKHLHIAHLVTPSMLLFVLFVLLFDCVWEGMKSRAPLVGREDEFIF